MLLLMLAAAFAAPPLPREDAAPALPSSKRSYGDDGAGEEKNREEAIEEFMLAMVKEVRGRALSPDIDVHPQLHHGL